MTLPEEETLLLRSLSQPDLHPRLKALNSVGWPISTLANALSPARPKATVHYWISRCHTSDRLDIPLPHPLKREKAARPVRPTVSPEDAATLRSLSQLARRHRARQRPDAPQAIASRELTILAAQLNSTGVPTAAIAKAAGISYRAMHKRITNSG